MGLRRRRRQPGAESLHHSAPLRFALGTVLAGGSVVAPGPFDPVTVTAAIGRAPADHDVLRAGPPAAALRALGRARRPRPLVVPAGRARRRPVPAWVKERLVEVFPSGSTWEFYGSTEGQFTACRSEEERARPGTVGPRTARAHDDCRRRQHPVVRRTGSRAVQLLRRAGEDRGGVARDRPRPGVHGRRHRPHRRRGVRVPRCAPRGPRDLRRRERLPDRGGERAPRGRRGQRHRGFRLDDERWGSGCARRSWAPPTPARSRRTRGNGWRRRSDPRSTTGSTSCRAPRPARCAAATFPR